MTNTVIYLIIDALLALVAFLMMVLPTDSCSAALIYWWYWVTVVASVGSICYHAFLIKELRRGFMSKRLVNIGYAIEVVLFLWFIFGHVVYYQSEDQCAGDSLYGVMLNLLIISYVRLLRIITVVIFVILCCPILLLCQLFTPRQIIPANESIIKNLNKLRFSNIKNDCNEGMCAICLDDFGDD